MKLLVTSSIILLLLVPVCFLIECFVGHYGAFEIHEGFTHCWKGAVPYTGYFYGGSKRYREVIGSVQPKSTRWGLALASYCNTERCNDPDL